MGHSKMHMKMKGHKKGGRVFYEGGESKVAHEAEEKKGGGKVEGHKGKHRIKKARGGSCDANPFSSAHKG